MEMEPYANFQSENIYETPQTSAARNVAGPPAILKQDNNKGTNKKTLIVLAISLGICFLVSVAAFTLIMHLQSEVKHLRKKLKKISENDSSLVVIRNDIQKRSMEIKHELEIIKNEQKQLESKIFIGDNKLNVSLTDANSNIDRLVEIRNDTQKSSIKTKHELKIIKNELKQLESKIFIGDNKLNESLTDANSNIDKLVKEIMNGTQRRFIKMKNELEIIKNEQKQLESKIFIGDNKLNKSLTDANSNIDKLLSMEWFRASNNLFYKRFVIYVNYVTAKAQCEGLGARLVSTGIRNIQVKNEIFPGRYLSGRIPVWIGLDDINSEGMWVWSDGGSGSPMWETSEPNGGESENCAVVILLRANIGVHDVFCSRLHKFVCEREYL
ncbi:uncharacterized protein LOC144428277 [Styela clava]